MIFFFLLVFLLVPRVQVLVGLPLTGDFVLPVLRQLLERRLQEVRESPFVTSHLLLVNILQAHIRIVVELVEGVGGHLFEGRVVLAFGGFNLLVLLQVLQLPNFPHSMLLDRLFIVEVLDAFNLLPFVALMDVFLLRLELFILAEVHRVGGVLQLQILLDLDELVSVVFELGLVMICNLVHDGLLLFFLRLVYLLVALDHPTDLVLPRLRLTYRLHLTTAH